MLVIKLDFLKHYFFLLKEKYFLIFFNIKVVWILGCKTCKKSFDFM